MNIFEFAMEKEKRAEALYRDLAATSKSPGLKYIFGMLADAEVKHYHVVERMQKMAIEVPPTNLLDETMAQFKRYAADYQTLTDIDDAQVEVYRQAQQFEKEAVDFYTAKAVASTDAAQAKIFRHLANQEKMHYVLLDGIIEFVNMPESYVANAEFSHILDKYKGTDYDPDLL